MSGLTKGFRTSVLIERHVTYGILFCTYGIIWQRCRLPLAGYPEMAGITNPDYSKRCPNAMQSPLLRGAGSVAVFVASKPNGKA